MYQKTIRVPVFITFSTDPAELDDREREKSPTNECLMEYLKEAIRLDVDTEGEGQPEGAVFAAAELDWDAAEMVDETATHEAEPDTSITRRRWVLYDLDCDSLLGTRVYSDYDEAVEDAAQANGILVLPLMIRGNCDIGAQDHDEPSSAIVPPTVSQEDRDQAIQDLLAKAESAGLKAEDFDDIVHELAASIAADTNNESMEGQLAYMIDQLGVHGGTKQLGQLAEERSEIETTKHRGVTVNDNKHTYALRIDGPLLAKQRELLLKVFDTVFRGDPYEPESPNDQDLLQGVIALLDEIADQGHDQYGIASLLEPEADESETPNPDNEYRCECEEPGYFCSGIPGILAHLENGHLPEGAVVERCGLCCRYPSDAAALEKLREIGHGQP